MRSWPPGDENPMLRKGTPTRQESPSLLISHIHGPDLPLHSKTMEVEKSVRLAGSPPPYRINSTYCQLTRRGKPYLFVFGGYDDTNENFDDRIYLLDVEQRTWYPPQPTGVYRNGSSCVCLDDDAGNVVIVGGLLREDEYLECLERSNNRKSQYQDCFLLIFNVESYLFNMDWNERFRENLSSAGELGLATWSQMNKLERHSICLSRPNHKIYISGGVISDLPYGMQKYMYILDYEKFTVEKVEFCKKIEHEIMEVGNKIWSFGGINETMKYSFMNIQTFDLQDHTVDELNLNINDSNIFNQGSKKRLSRSVNSLGFKKFFYTRISSTQILITDLLHLRFVVLNIDTFKMYQVPVQIDNLNWLFVLTYNDNLSIIGGTELDDHVDEVAYLDYIVVIPLTAFGRLNSTKASTGNEILLEKLQNAYKEERFVDFQIKSNDNKVINVHKLYLLLKWPYFEKMIMSGMLESHTNEMVIDEPYANVKLLVDYLYTSELPHMKVQDLLMFAHLVELYDLNDLKNLIVNRIYLSKLPLNQLIEFWQLSDIINSKFLKKFLQTMIYKYWGYIVRLPSFQNLEKEQLLELFSNLAVDSQIVTSNSPTKATDESRSSSSEATTLEITQTSVPSYAPQSTHNQQIPSAYSNFNDVTTVTPDIETASTFDVFRSPGIVDYWTPLEPGVSNDETSSSASYMGD